MPILGVLAILAGAILLYMALQDKSLSELVKAAFGG